MIFKSSQRLIDAPPNPRGLVSLAFFMHSMHYGRSTCRQEYLRACIDFDCEVIALHMGVLVQCLTRSVTPLYMAVNHRVFCAQEDFNPNG